MNERDGWVEMVRLQIVNMQDVLVARFVGRDEAARMGFSPGLLTRVATAISEITRNVVQHAGGPGILRLGRVVDGDRQGLRVEVADQGKGMADPERFLTVGNTGSVGAGLAATRKLVDRLSLRSVPGEGTTVTLEIWLRKEGT